MAGGQPPAAGEAERPPHLGLVGPTGTRLAGLEAIGRVLARGTLTCRHRYCSVLAPHIPRAPLPYIQILFPLSLSSTSMPRASAALPGVPSK